MRRLTLFSSILLVACGAAPLRVEHAPTLALDAHVAGAPSASHRAITREGARLAVEAVLAEARRNGTGASVAVVDDGGNLVAFERVDTTFAAGAEVSIGKARTAVMFRRPTSFFETLIRDGRTPMIALEHFTPLQGGVPIVVDGEILGAVGVSGASSAAQDEAYATLGVAAVAAAVRGTPATAVTSTAPVTRIDHETVAAAFAEGRSLTGADGYRVDASRRDEPGELEIHGADTDVILVVAGSATLVTGARPIDPRTVAPGEIRAAHGEGGESLAVGAGDVIVVPPGTAHQFTEVSAPLTYYVVKVSR